jgi:hypothetical protein
MTTFIEIKLSVKVKHLLFKLSDPWLALALEHSSLFCHDLIDYLIE